MFRLCVQTTEPSETRTATTFPAREIVYSRVPSVEALA